MRHRLPPVRQGKTTKIPVGGVTLYVTINADATGRAREMFVKADEGWQGWANVLAETASLYLQNGGTVAELARHWRGSRFDPAGGPGQGSSIPDAIARVMNGETPAQAEPLKILEVDSE